MCLVSVFTLSLTYTQLQREPECNTIINDETIDYFDQVDISHEMDSPPQEDEVKEAIGQLSNGKAPRADTIQAEVYKAGSPPSSANWLSSFSPFGRKAKFLKH